MIEVMGSSRGLAKSIDIEKYKFSDPLAWINVYNPGNNDLDIVSKKLRIPITILKNFLDRREIPRIERYKSYDVIILKYILNDKIKTLGMIKSENYILTMCSENVNIALNKDALSRGSDSLLKIIMNEVIKNFSTRLEKIEDKISYLEDITFDSDVDNDPKQIFEVKKELIYLKKAINFNKEAISEMDGFNETRIEMNQVVDMENTLSSRITSVMDMYMSFTSNKLNEIMKSFTVIASLLLLPMLISGIYGMNVLLPLGDFKGSFFIIIGIMVFLMILMLIYFKIKKWV